MEQLTILEEILVKLFLMFIVFGLLLSLFDSFKSEQNIRSKNRYIKVLERKLKGSDQMLDLLIGILGLIMSVSITYFILDTLFLKIKLKIPSNHFL